MRTWLIAFGITVSVCACRSGAGFIDGAVNIPIQELADRLDEVQPAEEPIIVYCASGGRSSSAAQLLNEAGFSTVYDLGGMANW